MEVIKNLFSTSPLFYRNFQQKFEYSEMGRAMKNNKRLLKVVFFLEKIGF